MLNQVTLLGRLVRDPDLRTTQSGVSVVNFTLAVDRDFGKENKEADFPTCIAWRNTAEFIAKHFTKGRMIAVTGALRTSSFTDKDGNKRYKTDVEVSNAYFADSKSDNSGNSQGGHGQSSGQSYGKSSAPKFEEVDDDDGDLPF